MLIHSTQLHCLKRTTRFIFLVDFSFMIEKLAGRQHYPQGKIINSFSSLFNSWELNNLPICQQNDQYFVKTVKRTTLKIAINHSTTRLHLTRRGSQTRDLSLHGDEKKRGRGGKDFDHMATKSLWKYAGSVLPAEIEKSFTVSDRVDATSVIFRARSGSAASGQWIHNRRRVGDESKKKNGKWKHVFFTEQAVPQRRTEKDWPTGTYGCEKAFKKQSTLFNLISAIYL